MSYYRIECDGHDQVVRLGEYTTLRYIPSTPDADESPRSVTPTDPPLQEEGEDELEADREVDSHTDKEVDDEAQKVDDEDQKVDEEDQKVDEEDQKIDDEDQKVEDEDQEADVPPDVPPKPDLDKGETPPADQANGLGKCDPDICLNARGGPSCSPIP